MQGCGRDPDEDPEVTNQPARGSCSDQCGSGDTGCSSSTAAATGAAAASAAVPPGTAVPPPGTVCMKCRKQEAEVLARGREPLCHPCLHEQLLSKVRNAVRMHALIQPGDRLALAYSGSLGAAALLHFLTQLRNPRTDRPARGKVSFSLHIIHIDESLAAPAAKQSQQQQQVVAPSGGQAAAHVGTSTEVGAAVQQYCQEPGVQYHCVPLESIFAAEEGSSAAASVAATAAASTAASGESRGSGSDSTALAASPAAEQQQQQKQRARLAALLASVGDVTGRADLVRHLRTHLLLRTAAELGCGRVALGHSATSLAAHIVAAAAKGCGYALPGDIHLVDARYGPTQPSLFSPLREVSARELALVCGHWGVPVPLAPPTSQQAPGAGGSSGGSGGGRSRSRQDINSLAAAFIAGMEAHNPGSVPNILNTVSKLEAFPWNDPAQAAGGSGTGSVRGIQQQQQGQQGGQQQLGGEPLGAAASCLSHVQRLAASVLCPICLAPLAHDELPGGSASGSNADSHTRGGSSGAAAAAAAAGCCLSCSSQILGNSPEAASAGHSHTVVDALPAEVRQRMAALAAAGAKAAAAAASESPTSNGTSCTGNGGVESLRAQIAEFMLE